MRKRQRLAFFAIAGLGLLAAIAPGLAAGLNITPNAGGDLAAGQGAQTVQGFDVININWQIDDSGVVTDVTFNIFRENDPQPTSSIRAENATVRVLLDDGSNTTWTDCVLRADGAASEDDGLADCDTAARAVSANSMTEVEIIAFDSN